MKNPDSRQAHSGFEQISFLPKPGSIPSSAALERLWAAVAAFEHAHVKGGHL